MWILWKTEMMAIFPALLVLHCLWLRYEIISLNLTITTTPFTDGSQMFTRNKWVSKALRTWWVHLPSLMETFPMTGWSAGISSPLPGRHVSCWPSLFRASLVFSLQTWLAETPEQTRSAGTPGYLSVGMACEFSSSAWCGRLTHSIQWWLLLWSVLLTVMDGDLVVDLR